MIDMVRFRDPNYKDAHLLEQGDFIIAVNECCAVVGNGPELRVFVSFFSYRWHVNDVERAKMEAELLKTRLDDMHRSELTEHTLADLAAMCLEHYRRGERQGWMEEIKRFYEHDCDDCIFLGPATENHETPIKDDRVTEAKPGEVDLYYCPRERPFPTVIARYGARPHEYKSGILFGMFDLDDDLREAYQRATAYGLINGLKLPHLNVIDQGKGSIGALIGTMDDVVVNVPDKSYAYVNKYGNIYPKRGEE
jgi:hypothetical protein